MPGLAVPIINNAAVPTGGVLVAAGPASPLVPGHEDKARGGGIADDEDSQAGHGCGHSPVISAAYRLIADCWSCSAAGLSASLAASQAAALAASLAASLAAAQAASLAASLAASQAAAQAASLVAALAAAQRAALGPTHAA